MHDSMTSSLRAFSYDTGYAMGVKRKSVDIAPAVAVASALCYWMLKKERSAK